VADKEVTLDQQAPAEDKKRADTSKKDEAHPPLLIEFMVTLSAIILVVVFFGHRWDLFGDGATLLDFVIRTSISILIIGGLLVIITRQISSGMSAAGKENLPNEADELDMQSPSEVN
jgi:hypothetical protein